MTKNIFIKTNDNFKVIDKDFYNIIKEIFKYTDENINLEIYHFLNIGISNKIKFLKSLSNFAFGYNTEDKSFIFNGQKYVLEDGFIKNSSSKKCKYNIYCSKFPLCLKN